MTQLELIPLTTEQKHEAGLMVAKLTLKLQDLMAQHAAAKKAMKELENAVYEQISRLSVAIRDGREPHIGDI